MLVINFLLYIASLVMLLSFMVCFMNSAHKERKPQDRKFDLVAGTLLVTLFIVLIKVFTLVNGGAM